MRINRLDLTRYGRFTGASLPFGSPCEGRPDLHIVYGDNEAGKTTTLNAMLDLVFGIDAATPYKFLHQSAALRLGGELEIGGDVHAVIRLSKTALLDADERPLPEGVFNQDTAGLDRGTYQTMFSLDEKTLAAGGESILASRGDLGQLLFSATAGLAAFSDALANLKVETEIFYKLHGRKHGLGELKRQLAELKERRTAIDITAAPFARLLAARDEAQAAHEAAVRERGRLQAELATVRRHVGTLPRLVEWQRLKSDCDELPDMPGVPQGWPESLVELQKTSAALGARHAAAREEVTRLAEELDALPLDEAGLAIAARVEDMAVLSARDATAARDLPDRRATLRLADARLTELLRDLCCEGNAAPRQLLLTTGLISRLRSSLEDLSGLQTAQREASAEFADAKARLIAAAAERESGTDVPDEATARLRSELTAVDADNSSSRLQLAERAMATHGAALAERLAALAPWQGSVDALAGLNLPDSDERERLAREFAAMRQRADNLRADADRLEDERHRTTRIRDGLMASGVLIGDAAALASRTARDAAWTTHLAQFDRSSATVFEQALWADDATVAARFAQASDISELRALNRSLDATSADLERTLARLSVAERDWRDAEARIASRAGEYVGLDCDAPLAALERFAVKRERALDARAAMRAAEADHAAAATAAAEMRGRLATALSGVGVRLTPKASLGEVIIAARAAQEILQQARVVRERVESLTRDVAERQRQLQRAEQKWALWQEDWSQMLRATWLADTEIDRVRDALPLLTELGPALDARDGLADRVAKMEADRAAFAVEIRIVADALAMADDGDIGGLAHRVELRARAATATAAARAEKLTDFRRTNERIAELKPTLDSTEDRARKMTSLFGVATLDDLAFVFDASRRREHLATRIRDLEVEICDACRTDSIDAAVATLVALDRDILDRRYAELEALCEDQVLTAQETYAALGRARDAVAAIDGDAAAARLEEERRTVLIEIETRTMAHLVLRAGIIAAEGAISLFRDRHRSSMMKQASDLFASLTRGAYSGLAAQSMKDGEVLVGLPAVGGSKLSTEMSTATRSQLYLALRIAAYREFTAARRPLPFVLDDVLETFDDARAEASLTLLADMARTGQVIYLTHHKHLCEIAQRVCPSAVLHDLGRLQ